MTDSPRKTKSGSSIENSENGRIERFHRLISRSGITSYAIRRFRTLVLQFYRANARPFPWRDNPTPYQVLVSEIMLQQTQADRVSEKFRGFMRAFPSPRALAKASLRDVLTVWQGLGYNRRAQLLHRAAQHIVRNLDGAIPRTPGKLVELPGIGPATAASIAAYAYGYPAVFIETNIRAVFIHLFFPGCAKVGDNKILPLAARTLDRSDPGRWYNALMDYGVMLKQRYGNPARRSRSHTVQSRFEGSDRQIRGMILRNLLREGPCAAQALPARLERAREARRVRRILDDLVRERLCRRRGERVSIADT